MRMRNILGIKSPSEHIRERGDNVANDLKSLFAFILRAFAMPPDGGYGGIDMCITCKKNGMDKYKDEETGQEWDLCERCPNNMTNAYKPMN